MPGMFPYNIITNQISKMFSPLHLAFSIFLEK